jgi:hypothetical protein
MRRILSIPRINMGILLGKRFVEFYNIKTARALEQTYIDHGADGLMSLQVELNGVITKVLE